MTTNTVNEGDFKSLNLDSNSIMMLEDAYQAVTKANRWGFLRRPDVPGDTHGFVPHVQKKEHKKVLLDIDTYMEYEGHSGSSYAWAMRAMERIAKEGWNTYVETIGVKPSPVEHFANSLETNTRFPYPCPCHKVQDKEGWCGVAGGGVPGCEH